MKEKWKTVYSWFSWWAQMFVSLLLMSTIPELSQKAETLEVSKRL